MFTVKKFSYGMRIGGWISLKITKQLNIYGEEDLPVDPKSFSKQAQDHIRLLRNLVQEAPVINRLDGISAEEHKYIQFMRAKAVAALGIM